MKNTRFAALALVLLLLLSAVGCGGGGDVADASGTPNASGTQSASGGASDGNYFTDEEVAPYRGTTVKYATWIEERSTESGPVISGFENETGIKVELVTVPQGTYATKMAALITAGQAPDVYCDCQMWPSMAAIADSVDKAGIDVTDPMWDQTVIKYGTINGRSYLVNTVNSMWADKDMIFYNKKIFADNAITTPNEYEAAGNWTWETLLKCMTDVKNAGFTGGYIDPTLLANSVGGSFLSYDINKAQISSNLDNPNFAAAWQFYYRALKSGATISGLSKDSFTNGECGVFMTGVYGLKNTGYWNAMDKDLIAFANMPKQNASDADYPHASFIKAWGLCKGSKNPKAAGLFLRYYLDIENYKKNGSYDSAFISEAARDFYFKINEPGWEHILVENGVGNLMEEKMGVYWFANRMHEASKKDDSQVRTAISTIRNEVQNACNTGNQALAKYGN